jgi:RND superfamily putative drug exporter
MVVLVITFGSLLAAGMPLLTAAVGVGVGLVSLLLASKVVTLSSTAPTLALMLGLAVGIDYALFILSRHRSQLAAGMEPARSAATAVATAGSAVVFAGLTVIIALVGLSVVRIPFLTVMGIGAAGTVAVAVAVAVTLLPALLGFAGGKLAPTLGSRAERRERTEVAGGHTGGERWVHLVTRYPALTALVVVAALVAMAIPAPGLRLALPDNGAAAAGSTQRKAYDLISAAFGPGFNGTLLVVVSAGPGAADGDPGAAGGVAGGVAGTEQSAGLVAKELMTLPGVLAVTQPQLSPDRAIAVVPLIPKTGPDAEATKDLAS